MIVHYWRQHNWHLAALNGLVAIGVVLSANNCAAQSITLDGTLGTARTLTAPNYTIRQADGQTVGSNLFHSFGRFNLIKGEVANFQSDVNIRNILSRVTGGSPSAIDGLITTSSKNVNLFLINPSGIVFGPNAKLEVGSSTRGSFVATTVDALVWANGSQFSATNPGGPSSLLTIVGDPSGFLSSLRPPQPITSSANLGVSAGQTLLLLGGNITLDGSNLLAQGGRVELAGVTGAGIVGLGVNGNILNWNIPENLARADVSLQNGSTINVVAGNGGSIAISGRNVDILGKSQLQAGIGSGLGTVNSQAGDITLNASGVATINQASGLSNTVASNTTGNAGNINIQAGSVSLQNSLVSTSVGDPMVASNATSNAGNINIQAGSVSLQNSLVSTATFVDSDPKVASNATGNAGNINIQAGDISINDQAITSTPALDASSSMKGRSGNVSLAANGSIFIRGSDTREAISTYGNYKSLGSGNISLTANNGTISLEDAFLNVSNQGGDAGNIALQGNKSVSLANNSSLVSTAFGQGYSGSITVSSLGSVSLQNSLVSTAVGAPTDRSTNTLLRNAGDIIIKGTSVSVTDGSEISSRTFSGEKSGKIQINATDTVEISGSAMLPRTGTPTSSDRATSYTNSTLATTSETYARDIAGDINISTRDLHVSDGATLRAESRSSARGGSINIQANTVELTGGGQLLTSAFNQGDAGNINLNVQDRIVISGIDSNKTDALLQLIAEAYTQDDLGGDFTLEEAQKDGRIRANEAIGLVNSEGKPITASGIFANTQGTGNAGNLIINAGSIRLDNNATLNANTTSINTDPNKPQATITISSGDLILSRGSNITTNATGSNVIGGNININTNVLAAVENSNISAKSEDFRGGQVVINTLGDFLSPDSEITARGASPQLNGLVQINTPDIDPSRGLVKLPTGVVNIPKLVSSKCAAFDHKEASQFIVTGRGGLPPNPYELLNSDVVWSDTRLPNIRNRENLSTSQRLPVRTANTTPQAAPHTKDGIAIVPATGWVFNDKGEVTLIASHSDNTYSVGSTPASCPKP